ncbi:hypothetical protein J1N35_006062 [Gossypium stocksii]|uniref:Uncharacterized protein n=1 Tax=Gossypium stocksii TaxID=47602 RepID=A0A9D3WFS9_9ROSI|nr:hypothetical protein J1N35_006062 [Gossypium stocksii]
MKDECEQRIKEFKGVSNDVPSKLEIRIFFNDELGQITANKRKASTMLNMRLANLSRVDPDDEIMVEIEEVKLALNLETDKEKMFWEERLRANWPQFGDRNTSFFHNLANQQKKRNTKKKLKGLNEEWVVGKEEKVRVANEYFKELFTASDTRRNDRVLSGIINCIQEDMNIDLVEKFKLKEVRETVKSITPLKALDVLNRRKEIGIINSTSIVLIPKGLDMEVADLFGRETTTWKLEALRKHFVKDQFGITEMRFTIKIDEPCNAYNRGGRKTIGIVEDLD